ncbi:protein YohO [Pantoea sp. 1.19]|nr:protein YohO [Pantoea sp. 1.19]
MNWQKMGIVTLFLIMTLGGIGGLMLVGYSIILHAG